MTDWIGQFPNTVFRVPSSDCAVPKPGFLDTCEFLGYIYGERRWRSPDGRYLYTWDGLHGEIEVFDRRGRHSYVADAVTGVTSKPKRKGRRIRV